MIQLVGPGGAGKSTVGRALATHLNISSLDLDFEFMAHVGDISHYINQHGYEAYARENVKTFLSITGAPQAESVLALSSGFMTYPHRVHPSYTRVRSDICTSPTTFVLIPSLDLEKCVRETVRRQLGRPLPFARSPEREEAVIRERYTTYTAIPATKIETMRPLQEIVQEIAAAVPPNWRVQPTFGG
jgi:shikimate kinase